MCGRDRMRGRSGGGACGDGQGPGPAPGTPFPPARRSGATSLRGRAAVSRRGDARGRLPGVARQLEALRAGGIEPQRPVSGGRAVHRGAPAACPATHGGKTPARRRFPRCGAIAGLLPATRGPAGQDRPLRLQAAAAKTVASVSGSIAPTVGRHIARRCPGRMRRRDRRGPIAPPVRARRARRRRRRRWWSCRCRRCRREGRARAGRRAPRPLSRSGTQGRHPLHGARLPAGCRVRRGAASADAPAIPAPVRPLRHHRPRSSRQTVPLRPDRTTTRGRIATPGARSCGGRRRDGARLLPDDPCPG